MGPDIPEQKLVQSLKDELARATTAPTTSAPSSLDETIDPSESPTPPPSPALADRYRLVRPIGRGGFGVVWLGTDLLQARPVAIKFLPALSPESRRKIRHELAALRWARLPGVVPLLDDGDSGDQHFLVTEFIDGTAFPGRPAPVPWRELAPVAIRLLEILAGMGGTGLTHGDLKPANILVRADGEPVIIDFGLARGHLAEPAGRAGAFTPRFAAPEQIDRRPIDPRTDLYAVGLMLYAALTGEVPHTVRGRIDLLARRSTPAAPLARLQPDCPPRVAAVIDRLLAPDPADRFASATDVLAALGADEATTRAWAKAPTERGWPDPASLESLFAGPEHFFRRRSRAAMVLWSRTGGDEHRVHAELDAWLHAGLARVEGAEIVVDDRAIEHLAAPITMRSAVPTTPPDVDADVLDWVRLLWPRATHQNLREVLGRDVSAAVDGLLAAGLIWPLPSGRLGADLVAGSGDDGVAERHRTAARVLTDPELRVRHLLASGVDPSGWLTNLAPMARELARQGRLDAARRIVDLGLELARRVSPTVEGDLLVVRVGLSLATETPAGWQGARLAIERCSTDNALIEPLELLVQATEAAGRGESDRALSLAAQLAPFADETLEDWRQVVFITAELRHDLAAQEARMTQLQAWADDAPAERRAERQALVAGWRGNLRYRQSDFAGAAALHAVAAAGKRAAFGRLASRYNQAMALLDALELEAAEAAAQAVMVDAARLDHRQCEAAACWIARSAAYRLGRAGPAAPGLVDAAFMVSPFTGGLLAFNEAAIAWRAGDRVGADGWCGRALEGFTAPRHAAQRLSTRVLRWHVSADRSTAERRSLLAEVREVPLPRVAVQLFGLLGPESAADQAAQRAAANTLTPDLWPVRLEITSFAEALGEDPLAPHDFGDSPLIPAGAQRQREPM